MEKRIGILGNVDSGKSTIIGVIKNNILDNGRGLARSSILKHPHEKASGRTSSITHHYLTSSDINNTNTMENTRTNNCNLTFIDLAGHEKYYKTTIHGVNTCSLDYIVLMIGSNMGVSRMTIEHLTLILILKIPFIVVFSKIDMCPENIFNQSMKDLINLLEKYKVTKKLVEMNSKHITEQNYDFHNKKIIPYFKISNISGQNIDLFKNYLSNIDLIYDWNILKNESKFAIIEDTYSVNGVGLVLSVTVTSGTIHKNDRIMCGPFNGIFVEIQVKSLHNNFRELVDFLEAGKSGCINIKCAEKKTILKRNHFKRGLICLDKNNSRHLYKEFEAKIKILHHPTTIKKNYESIIHCGSIKQVAKIIDIDKDLLRTGDQSIVKFRFKKNAEFLQNNTQIIFREGKTKGIGYITQLIE